MSRYDKMKDSELRIIARAKKLKGYSGLGRRDLISLILIGEGPMDPLTKYYSYLSGLDTIDLHEIARENKFLSHESFRRKDMLISLLERKFKVRLSSGERRREVERYFGSRMFPDGVRAWVGLFVSDENMAEHFAQIILNNLSSVSLVFVKSREERLKELAEIDGVLVRNLYLVCNIWDDDN